MGVNRRLWVVEMKWRGKDWTPLPRPGEGVSVTKEDAKMTKRRLASFREEPQFRVVCYVPREVTSDGG